MKKNIIFIVIFIMSNCLTFSNVESENTFIQANILYKKGDFSKAINQYEQILKTNFESTELYYNLGNSYYKLKQIPNSILNFEKALKLNPNDEDIQNNLIIANAQIVDKIDAVPQLFFIEWINQLQRGLNSDAWGILTIVFFWLTIICLFIFLLFYSSAIRKTFFPISVLFLILSAMTFIFASNSQKNEENSNSAIIMSPSAYVKSSPDEKSIDLFILHEGTKIKILDEVGEYRNIKLVDGRVGWILKVTMEKI